MLPGPAGELSLYELESPYIAENATLKRHLAYLIDEMDRRDSTNPTNPVALVTGDSVASASVSKLRDRQGSAGLVPADTQGVEKAIRSNSLNGNGPTAVHVRPPFEAIESPLLRGQESAFESSCARSLSQLDSPVSAPVRFRPDSTHCIARLAMLRIVYCIHRRRWPATCCVPGAVVVDGGDDVASTAIAIHVSARAVDPISSTADDQLLGPQAADAATAQRKHGRQ